MLNYLSFCFILMFVAKFVSSDGTDFDCLSTSYTNESIPIFVCKKGCTGIAPNCNPDCGKLCPPNSICMAPNTCECKADYERINQTDSLRFSCKPKCECIGNASCVQPNVCRCDDGNTPEFSNGTLTGCVPICSSDCPKDSYCAAPNLCHCYVGFKSVLDNEAHLISCLEDVNNTWSTLHILIYSLLICLAILLVIYGIYLIRKCLKGRRAYATREPLVIEYSEATNEKL